MAKTGLLDNILDGKLKSTFLNYLYIRWSSGLIFKRKKILKLLIMQEKKKKKQQQQNVTKNNKCYCLLTFILARAWQCIDLCNLFVSVCDECFVLYAVSMSSSNPSLFLSISLLYHKCYHFSFKNSSGFHQKDKSLYEKHNI